MACGQTLLPDSSILIEQKLAKNPKIKIKCDILSDFQTSCHDDYWQQLCINSPTYLSKPKSKYSAKLC